jgi:hypothetical protein
MVMKPGGSVSRSIRLANPMKCLHTHVLDSTITMNCTYTHMIFRPSSDCRSEQSRSSPGWGDFQMRPGVRSRLDNTEPRRGPDGAGRVYSRLTFDLCSYIVF